MKDLSRPQMPEIRTVAIIGTGIIGSSWACLFLAHGLDVVATDIRSGAEAELRKAVEQLWLSLPDDIPRARASGKLFFHEDLALVCEQADFVQECAIERLDAKVDLFARLDAATRPGVIIATSSSAIQVSDIQGACRHPERVVLGHPFNPSHLVPLVEVAGGNKTSLETLARAESFYRSLGKVPIRLNKEIYGHIANRLQAAIFREAIHLLESGVAGVEDIDRAVSEGPGLRWALMGPLLTYHLAGGDKGMPGFWDMFGPMQERLWEDLGTPQIDKGLQERVANAVERTYGDRDIKNLATSRDALLQAVLAAKSTDKKG